MAASTVLDDLDSDAWNRFVNAAPGATFYHQHGWKELIAQSFGHRCHYLAALSGAGECEGVLPLVEMRSRIFGHFLVSMPFVNYGGLLCATETAARTLLEQAERIRQDSGAEFVELRHLDFFREGLPTRRHKVTMILDLAGDAESQWKGFRPEIRNRIRRAEKAKLELAIGHLDLLDDFYRVFAHNMRDLGTPVLGMDFFRNLLNTFPDSTRIFTIRHDGQAIAAAIALWHRDTLEFPWVSSIRAYRALCPNNMLYWEAIRYAIGRGFAKFDFGRSTRDDSHEGTFNFKKQWGAHPVQLHWQYLTDADANIPELNPNNPKYRLAIRVWQHLPVPVTRVLGPLIVRGIP